MTEVEFSEGKYFQSETGPNYYKEVPLSEILAVDSAKTHSGEDFTEDVAGDKTLCDKDPAIMYLIRCMPKGLTESVNYIFSLVFKFHWNSTFPGM